jgi:hypothetical protein
MARIDLGLAQPYICPECHKPGTRGRLKAGPLADCCALCLIALNAAIAQWYIKHPLSGGDGLPF